MKGVVVGASYIPLSDYPRVYKNRNGYHHDTNYPKLIAMVVIEGRKEIVCIGNAIRAALVGRKKIPKNIRDLVIKNRPLEIEVTQRKNGIGVTYYEITDESAKMWLEYSLI